MLDNYSFKIRANDLGYINGKGEYLKANPIMSDLVLPGTTEATSDITNMN